MQAHNGVKREKEKEKPWLQLFPCRVGWRARKDRDEVVRGGRKGKKRSGM
jgi:hypothetical protein